MLLDRYPPVNLVALAPKLITDVEPVLRERDRLLDDDVVGQCLKTDRSQRHRHSLSRGRPSTPVVVVLRLLVVKRLYGWSYEQVEHFVADSLVLRHFCRGSRQPVPDDTTLRRWANLIDPQTGAQRRSAPTGWCSWPGSGG